MAKRKKGYFEWQEAAAKVAEAAAPIHRTDAIVIGGGSKAKYLSTELACRHDVEVWGINAIRPDWVPKWTRMFNLHRYDLLVKYAWPVYRDAQWCADHPSVRFFTMDKWPDKRMDGAEIFPHHELALYPRGKYHCNSCDWLIAYATHLGFKRLYLHGFGLAHEGVMEQVSARACAEYWAGFAEAKGTEVILAEDSDLFTPYHLVRSNRVYGLDDCPPYEDRVTGRDPPFKYDDSL